MCSRTEVCPTAVSLCPKVGCVFPETLRPTIASDTAQCSVSTSESRRLRCANMISLQPIIFASYGCILP